MRGYKTSYKDNLRRFFIELFPLTLSLSPRERGCFCFVCYVGKNAFKISENLIICITNEPVTVIFQIKCATSVVRLLEIVTIAIEFNDEFRLNA